MESFQDLVDSIRKVRHFKNLKLADVHTIVTSGQVRKFPAETMIFTEGEPCAGMFVLFKGRVHLSKIGPQGKMNIIAIIEPVIMFNEVAVLDGGTNPVTATAIEPCLAWQISHDSFENLVERIPQVGLSLLKVLASRNREMLAQLENLSFRSVVARTARLLIELSSNGKESIDRRSCSIIEMASRITTVPEAISRSLKMLKDCDAILVSRYEIRITSIEKLTLLAQVEPKV